MSQTELEEMQAQSKMALPKLVVSEKTITQYLSHEQAELSTSFKIGNSGNGRLDYMLSNAASWMTLNRKTGYLVPGESHRVMLTCVPPFLNAGRYESLITVASNGGYHLVRVVAVITAEKESWLDSVREVGDLRFRDFVLP